MEGPDRGVYEVVAGGRLRQWRCPPCASGLSVDEDAVARSCILCPRRHGVLLHLCSRAWVSFFVPIALFLLQSWSQFCFECFGLILFVDDMSCWVV